MSLDISAGYPVVLTASSAKALALVVLFGALGPVEGRKRLPLAVASSGPNWIVRGRTSPLGRSKELMRGFHVYIDKSTAEVRDLETMDGNFKIPAAVKRIMRSDGWKPPSRLVLGLPPDPGSSTPPDLILLAYNGVLGTPNAAIAYARVLMRTSLPLAAAADGHLVAELRGQVWHVMQPSSGVAPHEVMALSQISGKVLSGDL